MWFTKKPEPPRFHYIVNGTRVLMSRENAMRLVEQGISVIRDDGRNHVTFTDDAVLRGREALATLDIPVIS